MIGYMFNTVLPGRVGELVRASLISQTDRVSTARALGTIVVEKILDVLVLLLLLGLLTALLPLPAWATTAGISATLTFGALAAGFFVLGHFRAPIAAWVARHLDGAPFVSRLHPSRMVDLLLGASASLKSPRFLALMIAISIGLWGLALATVLAILRAFHVDVPWTAGALVLVVTNLGMTVPSAPGYIGVYHYLTVLALGVFDVERSAALSFALGMHALGFGSFTLVGAAFLVVGLARRRYRVADLWRWQSHAPQPARPARAVPAGALSAADPP
jgi:uncharacterized protein (TIRG00374 family)